MPDTKQAGGWREKFPFRSQLPARWMAFPIASSAFIGFYPKLVPVLGGCPSLPSKRTEP